MRLEEGKYYLGADGRKYGPVNLNGKYWDAYSMGLNYLWHDDGTGLGNPDLIAVWTDEPETLTVARVEFNGDNGNARVILSNGMELSGVVHAEAETCEGRVIRAGIVVEVG